MKRTFACAILMALSGLIVGNVRAQTVVFSSSVPTPRAVSVGDTAYWAGKPHVLIAADVDDLHVSSDRRFVLAICRNPQREPFETEVGGDAMISGAMDQLPQVMRPRTGTVSLVVFDSFSGRVSTIWKRTTTEDERLVVDGLRWFADSKTALATVSVITLLPEQTRQSGGKPQTFRSESVDTSLLLLRADLRSARPLPLLAGNDAKPLIQIVPAPSVNRALVTVRPKSSGPSQFRFVDATGTLTEPSSVDIGFSFFSGWTEDGTKVTGFAMPKPGDGGTEPRDITVDGKTGAVTLTERVKGAPPKPGGATTIPEWRTSSVDKDRPVKVLSEKVTLTPIALNGNSFAASPVILRSATDPKEGIIIAPDGEPCGIVGDNDKMTVLYRSQDALYGIALRKAPRAEYETAVRRLSRLRANGINDDLAVWRLSHENQYPSPGTDIVALFRDKPTLDGSVGERFLDPVTRKPAFTYLYRGTVDGESTPLFSFSSIGGRYVFYTGGYRPHWIAEGTAIPATEPKGAE